MILCHFQVTKLPLGVDIGVEPFNSSWHSEQKFEMSAKFFEKPPDLIEIPLWIIILSILGGLLLLVLLFTLLYFVRFEQYPIIMKYRNMFYVCMINDYCYVRI